MAAGALSATTAAPIETSDAPTCLNGCIFVAACPICDLDCPGADEEQPAPPASPAPVTVKFVLSETWGKDPAEASRLHYVAGEAGSAPGFARPKIQVRYEPNGSAGTLQRFYAGCSDCNAPGCPLDGVIATFDSVTGGNILTGNEVSPTLPGSLPAGSTVYFDIWSSDGTTNGVVYASASQPSWVEIPFAKDNFQIKSRITPSFLGISSTPTFAYYLDNTDATGPTITKLELTIPGTVGGTEFFAATSVLSVDPPIATYSVTDASKGVNGTITVNFSPALTAGQSVTIYFTSTTPPHPAQTIPWDGVATAGQSITVGEIATDSHYTAILEPPPAVVNATVAAQNTAGAGGELRVTWDHPGPVMSSAVTAYLVYRGSSPSTATTWVASVPPSGPPGTGLTSWKPAVTIVTQTSGIGFNDAGLPNGVLECYSIVATNPVGAAVAVGGICASAYQDPRGVNALTALTRSGAVELSWDPAVAGTYTIAQYEIRRATCAACAISSSTFIAGATTSTWVDTTVIDGVTYRYEVRALDSVGHAGAVSPSATGAPRANPPSSVTLWHDPLIPGVALQWSPAIRNVYSVSAYIVYRASCTACVPDPGVTVTTSAAATVFIDSSVLAGRLYLYSVATVTDEGGWSEGPRSTSLRILVPPATPFGLTVSSRPGNELHVEWSLTSNATGLVSFYRLSRAGPGTATAFILRSSPSPQSTTAYNDLALTAGGRYYYRVTAVLQVPPDTAESPSSPVVSHVIEPSTPAGLTGTPDDGIIRLRWTDLRPAQEVDLYHLYRATGAPPGATIFLASVTTTYYDDTNVTNGITYTYRIAAENAGGISATSVDTLGMIPFRPPLAPQWLTASSGLNRATLSWGPAPTTTWPLATYEIYRGTTPGSEALVQTLGFAVNSYVNTGLQNGVTYYFKIRAVDTANNAGPFGNTAVVTPAIPPCPPSGLTGKVTVGQVELAWIPVIGSACSPAATFAVSGYAVYRSTYSGGGRSLLYTAVGQYATAYTDATVAIGITYYYAVRAFDTVLPPNESVSFTTPFGPAYSPEIAATPRIPAGSPQSLTILPGEFSEHDTKLHLAWAPSATGTFQVIGYDVYRALGAGLPEVRVFVSGGGVGSYLDTGLTNGQFYYYRVAPVEEIGVTGEWAGVGGTPYADPAAPAVLTLQEGDATLTLAWVPAAATSFPVTGYRITRATYAGFLDGAGMIVGPDPLFATSYADTPVVNAMPYWYRVQTWDTAGHLSHARSPEASGTPYARPAAPAWLTITSRNASVNLDWTPAAPTTYPVSAYVVYRATFSGAGSCAPCAIATVWGDTASVYLATGLANGVTVFTAVATRDALGHIGLPGNEAAIQPAVAPCPPATLTAQSGTVTVAMQWSPVNGALCGTPSTFPVSGYRIYRTTTSGATGAWLADVTGPGVSVYTDATPVPGITYYYAVRAFDDRVPVNAGSVASPQAPGTARTPAGPPLALTVQGEPFEHDGMAKLLWSPAAPGTLPVAGYNVYRSSCTGCPETRVFGPGSDAVLSYLDTGISNTVYWEYRVTTVESGFFEGGSAVVSTTPFEDPDPPVALTVREGNAQLLLGWTPAPATSYPVTAYRVSRATYPGTVSLPVVADWVYATSYTDSALANGTTYFYHLQALDVYGHPSHAYSAEIGGTPYAAPAAPGNLTAYSGDMRVTISWDAAAAGTYPVGGYAVYRLAGTDPGCGLAAPHWTVGGGTLQLIDTVPANDGTFYHYRVAAFDAVSSGHLGPCSAEVSASPYAGIDPPGKPNGLSAVPVAAAVGLAWQPAAPTTRPVAGYAIHRTTFTGNLALPGQWTASVTGATTSTYVDGAVANGFVYYYRTRAFDDYASAPATPEPYVSEPSNESRAFVAQPPQNLTVLSLVANQLYLGWEAPAVDPAGLAIAGYRVHRSTGADGPYGLVTTTLSVTYFDDTAVTRGQATYYRVEAQHQDGWISVWSSTGFATPGGAPSAPVVTAVADDGLVTLAWPPASTSFPPIRYEVLRGTFPGFPADGTAYGSVPDGAPLAYADTGATSVVNGTPYYYRVMAVDTGFVSTTSLVEPFALPLARPQTLTAVPGDSRITLGWGASPFGLGGVSGYLVYRRTLIQAEGVAATIFGASATSYVDLAVANGVMYYYRVRAFDSITAPTNYGPFSVETQGRPITPPGPPTIAQIWPMYGAIDLCWTGASPPGTNPTAGYKVWRSSNGGPFSLIATLGTVTCYGDTGLQNGVSWGYRVAAFDTASPPVEGPQSNTVAAVPYDVPAPPGTLTTFAASGQVLLGWAAAVPSTDPVAGYNVYRGTVADGESPVAINGSLVTTTYFLNTGLVNGTRYYYKIRAQDTQGRLSATSAEISGLPFTPPAAPALSAAPADRRVDLGWTASSGTYAPVTAYRVYRGTFAGFTPGAPELETTALVYVDLTVTNGTPYYYRIGARDSDFVTGPHETFSNEQFILPLGVPTSLSAMPGDTRVGLAWTPSTLGTAGIAGYQVWRNAPASAPTLLATVAGATATVYLDLTAGNGTTWTYRVAPIDSLVAPITAGAFSATISTTPGIAWSAPVLVSAAPSFQRVDIRWTAPTIAGTSPLTAYRVYRSSDAGPFALWKSFAPTVTVFADTPVTNGVTWTYYVTAIDSGAPPIESPTSNTRSAVPFEPPLPPGNLTVLVRNGQIYLGWATTYITGTSTVFVQTSYPPSGFAIYRGTTPNFTPGTPIAFVTPGSATTYVDAAVARPGIYPTSPWLSPPYLPAYNPAIHIANGVTYYYKIQTFDNAGNASLALSVTANGTPFAPPAPPGYLSALPLNLGVRLHWATPYLVSAVSTTPSNTIWVGAGTYGPVSGYMIYRGLAPGTGTLLAGPVFSTTYVDVTAANGTAYFYTIRARNARGDEGEWSTEESVTPAATIVNPPLVVNATVGGSSVSLSWTSTVTGAPPTDQYVILRATCAACLYDTSASPYLSATVFAYTDNAVLAGGYYRYAVRAVVLAPYAESVDYPWTVITIASSCAVPATPAPVVATAGSGVAFVAWAASAKGCPADAVTYRVERSADGGASWLLLTGATVSLTYSDTGLVNGTTYQWRVTPSGTGGTGPAAVSAPVTPSSRTNEAFLSANAIAPLRGGPDNRLFIKFTLESRAAPKVRIYTLSGMKVLELENPEQPAGPSSGSYDFYGPDGLPGWSGKSEDGRFVASGVYLVEFTAGSFRKSLKVIVLK